MKGAALGIFDFLQSSADLDTGNDGSRGGQDNEMRTPFRFSFGIHHERDSKQSTDLPGDNTAAPVCVSDYRCYNPAHAIGCLLLTTATRTAQSAPLNPSLSIDKGLPIPTSDCRCSCYSSSALSVLVAVGVMYLFIGLIVNIFACYKFARNWTSRHRRSRMSSFQSDPAEQYQREQRRRERRLKIRQKTSPNNKKNRVITASSDYDHSKEHLCCPICLIDFYEGKKSNLARRNDHQVVLTQCDGGGCRTWFHCECLAQWLFRSDSCPCCRKDMLGLSYAPSTTVSLARTPAGWITELSVFLGFTPH